ncbi:MAG: lysine biosynthesis protein LysW [Candidatus Marinimicrobia bacterium]|nr:lysine biosynthesis protein LysW [Candidatus Neomarinimicrobiota bacterium]MCH7859558.1 lysine biosynthesis protein LysW [Candidatus Neomarinimicrobiota bacterium]
MSQQVPCPECGAAVDLAKGTVQSEIVSCGDCGVDLEVVNIDPLELAPAPEEEEDWGE